MSNSHRLSTIFVLCRIIIGIGIGYQLCNLHAIHKFHCANAQLTKQKMWLRRKHADACHSLIAITHFYPQNKFRKISNRFFYSIFLLRACWVIHASREKKLLFSFWTRTVLLIKAHEKKYELIELKPELYDAVFCSTPKIMGKLAIATSDLFIEFSWATA